MLKGNGKISWCRVSSICAGVEYNEKAREGKAVLLNGYSALVEFGCISF